MKKLFLFSIFIFAIQNISHSQPALAWSQRYNGPPDNTDQAVSIAVDAAGNSYVTGSAFASNGTLDIVTIKYSQAGQQMWLQSYNGAANDNDQGVQVVLDNVGNVYVTGYSKSVSNLQDITTIKYDNNGVQQWVSFYDGPFHNSDEGVSLAVDGSGNTYVTGYETDTNYTYNFVTIKYNPAGAQQWAQIYDGPGHFNDEPYDLKLDANSNVYVTGTQDTFYNSQPNEDMILMKYNSSGALQWKRIYDTPTHGYEYARRIAIDRNNDIIMAGYAFITGNGFDYHVLKYNSAGNFQWLRTYNYAANTFESPWGIVTDSLNNIIVTGQGITNATNNVTNDYVTVKWDPSGTFLWASRYNNISHGEDRASSVALDDSLNIYVTGYSAGTGTGNDIATVKYDPSGNQVYVLRFNNAFANGDDFGNAIALNNGDIYVTGSSANSSNDDYVTLRYSYSAVGIPENSNPQNSLSLFPNPTSGNLKIILPENFSTYNKNIHAEIINSLGQTVTVTEQLQSESIDGKSLVTLNTSGLPAGIFMVKVFSGENEIGFSKFVVE